MGDETGRLLDRAPALRGTVFGAGAYLLSFLFIYLLVFLDDELDPSTATETGFAEGNLFELGFPNPEPSTVEFVGWILYNAHFVDTVFAPDVATPVDVEGATAESTNLLDAAATQIPEAVYYLVPVVLLAACGYLLARSVSVSSGREAIEAGLMLLGGYVPLSLIGPFLFSTSAAGERQNVEVVVNASPELGMAVVSAIAFPLVFGIVGAFLAVSE